MHSFAAVDPTGWLISPDEFRSSTILLVTLVGLGAVVGLLLWSGLVDAVLWVAGVVVRGGTRIGFRVWEWGLAWAPWPLFLAIQFALLAVGVAAAGVAPVLTVACALAPLAMGFAACLAYMFIDVERYEVARGYKALHNPMKGQRLATELARYGHLVGVPLLASATIGMIGGFALLNFGLFRLLGTVWYTAPGADSTYPDFVASAIVHLLKVVDLLDLADTKHLARVVVARPVAAPAGLLLSAFKSLFTLVLLQQIFASVRKGRLLAETIADFWSPHEPIHERARSALPQYGAVALAPLLLSLRATDTLTREQREQLPQVLFGIGPAAIPDLIAHLGDPNEHVRAVAVSTLGLLRAADGLPHMIGLANDPSDLVRLSLAEALGEIGSAVTTAAPRAGRRRGWRVWRLVPGSRRRAPVIGMSATAAAVGALQTALTDSAAAVRAAAAGALGRLGPTAAGGLTRDLTVLLSDTDETVRGCAAEGLGAVGGGDPNTVPALAALLADPGPAIRIAAARALGAQRAAASEAVPSLVPLLQDRDAEVRNAAAEAIGQIGTVNGDASHALAEGLGSSDNVVRARTAEALGTIGGAAADAAPALVEAAGDNNDRVRAKAVEALGKMGAAAAEVAVPRLVRALRDPDNWVSALAAEALGEMGAGADEAVPALVRSLAHANAQVRANAAEALGKLGEVARTAAPALGRAATDADSGVRTAAVRALGAIGPPTPATAGAARAALADADPHARAAAAEAFGTWGTADPDTQTDLLALLDDSNDEVKVRAARVLPRLAEDRAAAVESLSRRLTEDDSDWVRAEAARALGQFGPAAAPVGAALLRAAQTGGADLREEAMRALAVAQPPEAIEAFTSGLRDAEVGVRKLASAGWRKAAAIPEEAVPALIEALHDPDTQVRANAAHAIGRLDPVPVEAVPLLAECAAAPDAGLRMNAALALQAVPGRAAADALHQLLDDPSPRLRLIAARRLLSEDATDTAAAAAVADVLAATGNGVRRAALALVEAVRPAAATILAVLRERVTSVTESESVQLLAEAVTQLELIVAADAPPADEPVVATVPSPETMIIR